MSRRVRATLRLRIRDVSFHRYVLVLLASVELVLPPARAAAAPPAPETLVYGTVGGHDLKLDLYQPATGGTVPHPVILFLHGGGWKVGSKAAGADVARLFTDAGYALASADYRLSGEAIFPAPIQDSKAAVRWLRANSAKYGLDPRRIGALGFSAGGHLAALLGTSAGVASLEDGSEGNPRVSSAVQAVCDVSGPVDLALPTHSIIGTLSVYGELGGFASRKPALVRAANPTTYLTPHAPPFLIIQGDHDGLVIPEHAQILAAALRKKGVPVEMVIVHGGGHVPFGDEQARTTLAFFERVFGKMKP